MCLAASTAGEPARALVNLYAKRWGIEGAFRDTKDLRFGMGMGAVHVRTPDRRDRLWLINAFAVVLLTLLGAAGEALGYDRHLKSNTTKQRTHSLFRQGSMLYELIPTMPKHRLRPLKVIEVHQRLVYGPSSNTSRRCWPNNQSSVRCSVQSRNEGSLEG